MVYLYALIDPLTNQIRYIGYTTHPKTRLRHHVNNCDKGKYKNTHKGKWINKLLSLGVKPVYKQLAEVEKLEYAKLLEMEMISHYRSFCELTNHGNGGEGTTGLKWSEESKTRIKETRKNLIIPQNYKEVIIINKKTKEVIIFKTSKEASEYVNCKRSSLTQCARGRRKSIKGYFCSYKKGAEQILQH